MNLDKALEILQKINSVCPKCNGKGVITKGGNILPCKNCGSKGYQTFEELVNETKETRKPKKARKKQKW